MHLTKLSIIYVFSHLEDICLACQITDSNGTFQSYVEQFSQLLSAHHILYDVSCSLPGVLQDSVCGPLTIYRFFLN